MVEQWNRGGRTVNNDGGTVEQIWSKRNSDSGTVERRWWKKVEQI